MTNYPTTPESPADYRGDAAKAHHADAEHHVVPISTYLIIWVVLMVLLVVTVVAAFTDAFGDFAIIIAMAIAVIKATVVVLWFMHVKFSSRLTQIFVVATMVWLGILFALSFSDYFTRGWMSNSEGWERIVERGSMPNPPLAESE